ncbi:uncharacterized protein LOC107321565 isoform X2 [Coturnix japonica]|uniref:uncharacterized protein LOC107321565 isoform X2 n=1 Tax=Coturnix japonica TaxID=93934 RepID=UPI0013A5E328|nr:uncharacterized protein LOC107321565 isoform X2 [Coturnix japonica]
MLRMMMSCFLRREKKQNHLSSNQLKETIMDCGSFPLGNLMLRPNKIRKDNSFVYIIKARRGHRTEFKRLSQFEFWNENTRRNQSEETKGQNKKTKHTVCLFTWIRRSFRSSCSSAPISDCSCARGEYADSGQSCDAVCKAGGGARDSMEYY